MNFITLFKQKHKPTVVGLEPVKLLDPFSKEKLKQKYSDYEVTELSYATVRDFCDSADNLPQICYLDGDLKNVQRAWTVKAIVSQMPLGGNLLEIGAGVPLVAGMLTELGYKVTVVDPYEGAGNGPTEYQNYVRQFPHVNIVRDNLTENLKSLEELSFDCIYSISVLEHIPNQEIHHLYQAIQKFMRPGGLSLHCVDHVIQGKGTQSHEDGLKEILKNQEQLAGVNVSQNNLLYDKMLIELKKDLETFYLSPLGHHLWRNSLAYDKFPFRKVVSIQTCVRKSTK